MFHWRFFRCPFCFRRPRARNLVMIFARTKSPQILFSGAIGKGKSLALKARTPRPTWFPTELLMPLLKKLFSEIPVVLWQGNWVGTSLTGSSFCKNTQRNMRFYPTSSAGSTFPIFSSPSKATSRGNFIILLLPQRRFFLIANRVLISRNLLVSLSLTALKTAHSWFGEKLALFSHPIWFCPLRWSSLSLECATMRVFWTYGLKILRFRWITFLAYLAMCLSLISKLLLTIKVAMTTSSCRLTVSPLSV